MRRLIDPAKANGEVPIFTVLRAQATGCSPTYQGGGPAEDRRTMDWYDDLVRVVGDDRVVIAFEPDSLGTIDCLAPSRRDDRLRVLGHGVDVLSKLPNATIYIEAGASDWEAAERTAKQLRAVGIAKVRGFMLNVTHYDWTAANIQHGLEISRLTGGKHFIINTAENGRGRCTTRSGSTAPGTSGGASRCGATRVCAASAPPPRPRPPPRQGRRVPVDQPARLRAELPAPADRVVHAAGDDARPLRDRLGEGPSGDGVRALRNYPLSAFNIP